MKINPRLRSGATATTLALLVLATACTKPASDSGASKSDSTQTAVVADTFGYEADRFADISVLRYQVPGFTELSDQQKELLFYLSEAARAGRDILWDQNYRHNIRIRKVLETILEHYAGPKDSPDWKAFETYAKRVFFSNGIHHHYSTKKIEPGFKADYFKTLVAEAGKAAGAQWPLDKGQTVDQLVTMLTPILFDPKVDAKRVNLDKDIDHVAQSANNFYQGLTEAEVKAYYDAKQKADPKSQVSWGLNSTLVKGAKGITEEVWKVGGRYDAAIQQIVLNLKKAVNVAENDKQRKALEALVKFYETGDLKAWDEYNVAWVQDTDSRIDVVNGFIEVYGDAIGMRGTYESVVSIKDMEATKRIAAIGKEAQWFEDNSPIAAEFKKKKVTGISAKVITVVQEAGDAAPATPIGINLPNANWIRETHGSKSVSLGNIVSAYDIVKSGGSSLTEFCYDEAEVNRAKAHGVLAGHLHTDMHEVIGHASGQLNTGISKDMLKNYGSCLEEARADLVALYYLGDKKLVDIGVMPSLEVGLAAYDNYIRNGLMQQLNRIELGENLEESHMRNRQLVAAWAFEKGAKEGVIIREVRNNKTYFKVKDYEKLRKLFGQLLAEIQGIISTGNFKAGMALVEGYGVKVDQALLKEVRDRYAALNTAPYYGFIQPEIAATLTGEKASAVQLSYPKDFLAQQLMFGKRYGYLHW